MVICGSYVFQFSVSKDMKKYIYIIREVAVGKVVAHFCLTLMSKNRELMLSIVGW